MNQPDAHRELAERIAGEVVFSTEPGATFRKWRQDFEVTQTDLADHLDVTASVVSDYENGRRANPGIDVVRRFVNTLLAIDADRGGHRLRQLATLNTAGFESDIVLDLREYPAAIPIDRFYEQIDGHELVQGPPNLAGHTVIDSIEAITRLSSDEFVRLYGQSTNRALVFTNVSRGESPLVALRVVTPTPHAVVLHGLAEDDLWPLAPRLAGMDGYSLAVTEIPLETLLENLREFP